MGSVGLVSSSVHGRVHSVDAAVVVAAAAAAPIPRHPHHPERPSQCLPWSTLLAAKAPPRTCAPTSTLVDPVRPR